MIRILAVATLAAMLVPASAEAAKFRSGGSRSQNSHASQGDRDGSSLVVTPGLRSRQSSQPAPAQPQRAATPSRAMTAEPVALRLTAAAEPRIWCRSQVVVGGFCVLN
ncbi:hypothetical protein [Bosea sp. (in: a-proteobacteria)]|uniref:hypothetical protein n=1 Tax=Bosea sp. (in: a-proteobacteria) TaxID=1871050 RepID=UPI002FCA626B